MLGGGIVYTNWLKVPWECWSIIRIKVRPFIKMFYHIMSFVSIVMRLSEVAKPSHKNEL